MHCHNCNKALKGRTDKRFCNGHCRSAYHNARYARSDRLRKNINRILNRNRSILLAYYNSEIEPTKIMLQNDGFSFQYFTHIQKMEKYTDIVRFCYDIGYRETKMLTFEIIKYGLLNNPQNRLTNYFVN